MDKVTRVEMFGNEKHLTFKRKLNYVNFTEHDQNFISNKPQFDLNQGSDFSFKKCIY